MNGDTLIGSMLIGCGAFVIFAMYRNWDVRFQSANPTDRKFNFLAEIFGRNTIRVVSSLLGLLLAVLDALLFDPGWTRPLMMVAQLPHGIQVNCLSSRGVQPAHGLPESLADQEEIVLRIVYSNRLRLFLKALGLTQKMRFRVSLVTI